MGESNFCRFCGTKFGYSQVKAQTDFDLQTPQPYSWKTDEFQTAKPESRGNGARPTEHINRPPNAPPTQFVPPPTQFAAPPQFNQPNQYLAPPTQYAPPANYRHNQYSLTSFRCPRCGSQLMPRYERKVSQAGWIVFAVLLVTTGIFFWIGLCMRENVCFCSQCNFRMN